VNGSSTDDSKLLEIRIRRLVTNVDPLYAGRGGAAMRPFHKPLDGVFCSLNDGFDGAIRTVSDPPRELKFGRALLGVVAKADALNISRNQEMHSRRH
jgi:hypothetical protein